MQLRYGVVLQSENEIAVDDCDKLRRQRKETLESEGWWERARWISGNNTAEKRLYRAIWEWWRRWGLQAAAIQQTLPISLSLFSSLSLVWSKMRIVRKITFCTGFSGQGIFVFVSLVAVIEGRSLDCNLTSFLDSLWNTAKVGWLLA